MKIAPLHLQICVVKLHDQLITLNTWGLQLSFSTVTPTIELSVPCCSGNNSSTT